MGIDYLFLRKLGKVTKKQKFDLSIVIPALNEEKRIGKTLDALHVFMTTDSSVKNLAYEVLVVSADSKDRTHDIASKHGKKLDNFQLLLPGKRHGKGRDVKYGMLRAKGKYIVFMDADLATPLHHLATFLKHIDTHDLVIATRNLKKHHSYLPRRLLSIMGNVSFRILGGVWIEDSQCGFKMFSSQAVKICFKRQTIMHWGFDMELLTIAKTNGLRIKAIRINDWEHVTGGPFASEKTITNALGTLKELIFIAHNRARGKYKTQ